MSASDLPESKLAEALAECERLREENRRLREDAGLPPIDTPVPAPAGRAQSGVATLPVTSKSSPEDKVKLFRSVFRGREDVYALRWDGRDGKSGYSPACRRVWGKVFLKRSDEPKEYFPLTDQVIHDHLTGKLTAGVYPLLNNETCWFLAADFDKTTWQDDVRAYLHTCAEWKVPATLERSRSGRGGHLWVFFEAPVPASFARKLGAAILTRTMERRHQLGLDSYDRFFPSQDTMPKGGFGNLIALPLQHLPRHHGNSVFLDADFVPHADQWALLSNLQRMSVAEVERVVRDAERSGDVIGVRRSVTDDEPTEDPWTLPPSRRNEAEAISGPLPPKVRVIRGNLIYVEKEGLPSAMLNRLHRLAAFQNPEFYRAQAMRLSTFGKPRVIRCAEEFPRHLALPRDVEDADHAPLVVFDRPDRGTCRQVAAQRIMADPRVGEQIAVRCVCRHRGVRGEQPNQAGQEALNAAGVPASRAHARILHGSRPLATSVGALPDQVRKKRRREENNLIRSHPILADGSGCG